MPQWVSRSCGAPLGVLRGVDEAEGGAAHSVETGDSWTIRWHAPEASDEAVRFWLAVNQGNGDESEFGDRIHLKDWEVSG